MSNVIRNIELLIEEIENSRLLHQGQQGASLTPNCGPTFIPDSTLPILRMIPNSGTRIQYKRGIRRITLQRLICSRIRWNIENVSFDEVLVLYDNLLALQDLSLRDPSFREKFGLTLEVLAKFLKSLNLTSSTPKNLAEILYRQFSLPVYENFLIPKRNLSTVEKHMCNSYRLLPTIPIPGKPKRELPPKRWIGIGYRDKGSARNPAKDGSPSWQEVAMSTRIYQKGVYIYNDLPN